MIGTDIDGPSSCYEDGKTALVVPPKDPLALAAALRRLYDDPVLRNSLAANARWQARRVYADEVIAELLDSHLSDLVALARGSGGRRAA